MTGNVLLILLLVAGLVVGAAFVIQTPILAIPIILLLPGPVITLDLIRRRRRQRDVARFRDGARTQKIDFDERDEATLA